MGAMSRGGMWTCVSEGQREVKGKWARAQKRGESLPKKYGEMTIFEQAWGKPQLFYLIALQASCFIP